MKIDELLAKYVQLRDKKQDLEKKHKEKMSQYTDVMRKIECYLLDYFQEAGVDSVKTENGTAYRTVRTTATVADREVFLKFIRENDAWAFLESRANKSAVEEYLDEHQELPPGVNVNRIATVNIRRS